jgi:hypothetical protein
MDAVSDWTIVWIVVLWHERGDRDGQVGSAHLREESRNLHTTFILRSPFLQTSGVLYRRDVNRPIQDRATAQTPEGALDGP